MEELSPALELNFKKLVQDLLISKTNRTLIQLFRFLFVGALAFVIDFISLFILTEFLNIHYLVSAAIAFLIALTANYTLSILWVFDKRAVQSRWFEFCIFGFIGMIGLGLNELSMWFFTEIILFHYLISKIISSIAIAFWNFFARKITLFS